MMKKPTYQVFVVKILSIVDISKISHIIIDTHTALTMQLYNVEFFLEDQPICYYPSLTRTCGLCKSVFNIMTEYDNTNVAS